MQVGSTRTPLTPAEMAAMAAIQRQELAKAPGQENVGVVAQEVFAGEEVAQQAPNFAEGRVKKGCKQSFVDFFKKIFSCCGKKEEAVRKENEVQVEEMEVVAAEPQLDGERVKKGCKQSLVDFFKRIFSCCGKKEAVKDKNEVQAEETEVAEAAPQLDGERVKKGCKQSLVDFFKKIFGCCGKKEEAVKEESKVLM
jgi:hypothetical protein